MSEDKAELTGSGLKLIAMLTMLLDHIGAGILQIYIDDGVLSHGLGVAIEVMYFFLRLVGRLSFPIYIFLLLEGFRHTRSRRKYALRLALFAVISEIPFDMAFNLGRRELDGGRLLELGSQNVFFTLFIGLAAICMLDRLEKDSLKRDMPEGDDRKRVLLEGYIVTLGVAGLAAYLTGADYGLIGVAAIIAAYYMRDEKEKQIVVVTLILALSSLMEIAALFDIFIIKKYRGAKGSGGKWLFYLFYPMHLLVIGLIKMWFM